MLLHKGSWTVVFKEDSPARLQFSHHPKMFNVTTILTFFISQRRFNLEDMGGKQADMTQNRLFSLQVHLQIQEMNPTMKFIF
jgi:hypothetical protein